MPKRGSLRTTLLWSFAITSITPIVLIGLFSLAHLTKTMRTSVRANQSILTHSIASEVSADLREPLAVLMQIKATMAHDHSDDEINEALDRAVTGTGFFESIYFLDADGKVEHAGLPADLLHTRDDFIGLDISHLPVHLQSNKTNSRAWSDSFISDITGKLSLTLSLPFGEKILTANFNIDLLCEAIHKGGSAKGIYTSIVDHNGNMVFSSKENMTSQKQSLLSLPVVRDGLDGKAGTYEYEVNGVATIGSSALVPETNWLVIACQDRDVAYASVTRIRNFFLFGISGAAVLAGLISYVLSSRLSQQLMSLTNTTRSISQGLYDVQLPAQQYREMEELAGSFRVMARAIQNREETLRQSEQTLQKSQKEYSTLIEGSPDIIMRFDRQGRHLFVRKSFESAAGIPAKSFIGKTHRELGFPEKLCDFFEEQMQKVFTYGEPCETEFEFDSPKGTIIFNWRLLPEKDAQGNVTSIHSIARDITEFKKVQKDYRLLFNNMLGGFVVHEIILDEAGKPKDFRYLTVNPSFEKLSGLKAPDIIGKTFLEVFPDNEIPWIETYGKAVLTGKSTPLEIYIHEINEHYVMIVFQPQQNQSACLFYNISSKVLVREALRESEQLFRSTFEQAAVGIANFKLNGEFTRVNQRFCDIIGFSRKELLQKTAEEIAHPQDLAAIPELWPKLVAGEIPNYSAELRLIRKDGTFVWANITVSIVRDSDGQQQYGIGVFEDISARKAIEQENQLLEEQLRQAMKMEAVGRLAGGVAHDFNNLLTPILGYTQMMLSKDMVTGKGRSAMEQVFQAANKAKSLTQQLLAFGRKQTFQPKLLNLNEAINSICSMLRRLITEDVEIQLDCDDALDPIMADPTQIDQVLMNLAINASDAMPDGGTITIRTANTSSSIELPLPAGMADDGFVRLEFIDTGCGMDEQIQNKIFEPFFTTKETARGTGLGLATVYGIVEQHGGNIQVESKIDVGTTFSIFLPKAQNQSVSASAGENQPTQDKPTAGTETILVVEDDPNVRVLVRNVLEDFGYSIVEASNADEAIEYAINRQGQIDLLLTDVIMPNMNGKELSEKLSTKYPAIKTLYMSGYPGDTIGQHGILKEGTPFIEKPFSVDDLALKIRFVLDA